MTVEHTCDEARAAVVAILAESPAVIMSATFVPFKHSRNRKEKHPSLNYRITLLVDGAPILETDYMMGSAYAPAHKLTARQLDPHVGKESPYVARLRREAIAEECETGQRSRGSMFVAKSGPIRPELVDVCYSLAMDSDALDYDTFADWADNLGYDSDSIKARDMYDACREHGAKLRRALGHERFARLVAAVQQM